LHNLAIKVDAKARAFQERLELDVKIDDNLILTAEARSLNVRDLGRCEIHDLEFALGLPGDSGVPVTTQRGDVDDRKLDEGSDIGALTIRTNIADRVDESLVPGEFLYQYNPRYFDTRFDPPELQVKERLYYEPCAVCRRASNDPACRCASISAS
jgi:hypothetical protein